jgi:hypothetical protein
MFTRFWVYQMKDLMLRCIVAFNGEKGLVVHMDWMNLKSFDLKPYFNRF